jgi:3-hydroxyisobutyrate dehydrogenase
MGLPMCANLVRAGYDVTAGDVREELQAAVIARGARWGGPGPAVAAVADVLITMLPGGPELRELMLAPAGVLPALPSTATWIDMTSTSPAIGRELASAARDRGIAMLEAPVGGGVQAAAAGSLYLFAGGDAELLERHRPVLEALADPGRIVRMGGHGAGYTTKHLVNLLWFGQAIATAEALLLARREGIDRRGPARRRAVRAVRACRTDLPAGPGPLRPGRRRAPARGDARGASRSPATPSELTGLTFVPAGASTWYKQMVRR